MATKKTAKQSPQSDSEAKRSSAKKSTVSDSSRKAASSPVSAPPHRANTTILSPALLTGGNPQIPKGYGDAPVQAFIAAMPGWKSAVGTRIDLIIQRVVPDVHKAVKWNSPFYGMEDDVWFASFHVFAKYVKVTFFKGAQLNPAPPRPSKQKDVRYLDIYEGEFDETQFAKWIQQASAMPGTKL